MEKLYENDMDPNLQYREDQERRKAIRDKEDREEAARVAHRKKLEDERQAELARTRAEEAAERVRIAKERRLRPRYTPE